MSQTINDLWYGRIAPSERCGARDPVIYDLYRLMNRNSENLRKELSEAQTEAFQKYVDCYNEYLLRMLELAFQEGFALGSKLTAEALV